MGTDHGYVPIALLEQKKISSAIAMDVNRGPLERAREHIAQYQMGDYIETRLSDGLHALRAGEGDSLLIAGMGGGLTIRILSEGEPLLSGFRELILEPQSDIDRVRAWLLEHGFFLAQENFVEEDGKYYPMMKVSQQKAAEQTKILPQEVADAFGPVLLQKRHPVLKEWLERELRTTNSVIEQLSAQPDHERIRNRMQQVNCKKNVDSGGIEKLWNRKCAV